MMCGIHLEGKKGKREEETPTPAFCHKHDDHALWHNPLGNHRFAALLAAKYDMHIIRPAFTMMFWTDRRRV